MLLTIPNEKCWYYLAVTILSALRGITSKHHSDFYCSNCLLSFSTKNKLKSHEKVCKNKDFWGDCFVKPKNNLINTQNRIKLFLLFMLTLNL